MAGGATESFFLVGGGATESFLEGDLADKLGEEVDLDLDLRSILDAAF